MMDDDLNDDLSYFSNHVGDNLNSPFRDDSAQL
jgi:hypothetical protein